MHRNRDAVRRSRDAAGAERRSCDATTDGAMKTSCATSAKNEKNARNVPKNSGAKNVSCSVCLLAA